MKRLVLDQGCPRTAVVLLNSQGWDVVHVGQLAMSRASDSEILEFARREGRVCVTYDADFHALLALGGATSPSTIRVRIEGLDHVAFAALLSRAWPQIESDIETGALVTIDHRSVRIRRLPIGWTTPA